MVLRGEIMAIKHYGFGKWYQESYDESETGGGVLDNLPRFNPILDANVEARARADRERMEEETLRIGHIKEDGSIEWETERGVLADYLKSTRRI